jgi:hypothetical protein
MAGFYISAATKLQVLAYWFPKVRHHTWRRDADRYGIILFFFPRHTACELQLMDKFVFGL